jgi:hypothetical protein
MLETIEQALIPSLILTVALLEKLAVRRDISGWLSPSAHAEGS